MKLSLHPSLERAQGYIDLGLYDEAWEELSSIPRIDQDAADSLHVIASLLMKEKRWEEALKVSRQICELQPKLSGGFIHVAYCLHELGRTREACQVLRNGPETLKDEPICQYNLSCYAVCLGKFEEARTLLERSFELDERLAIVAEHDPDLTPLWASL